MSKKELIGNRRYTDEFKVEAVRLGESIGGNKAAKRIGIPESSLWNWVKLSCAGKLKQADGAAHAVKRSMSDVEAENARLRRELASTKLDLEIVKKAAASSMGESNTCFEFSCGRMKPQGLSWALIQT
jgi:transposase